MIFYYQYNVDIFLSKYLEIAVILTKQNFNFIYLYLRTDV